MGGLPGEAADDDMVIDPFADLPEDIGTVQRKADEDEEMGYHYRQDAIGRRGSTTNMAIACIRSH